MKFTDYLNYRRTFPQQSCHPQERIKLSSNTITLHMSLFKIFCQLVQFSAHIILPVFSSWLLSNLSLQSQFPIFVFFFINLFQFSSNYRFSSTFKISIFLKDLFLFFQNLPFFPSFFSFSFFKFFLKLLLFFQNLSMPYFFQPGADVFLSIFLSNSSFSSKHHFSNSYRIFFCSYKIENSLLF